MVRSFITQMTDVLDEMNDHEDLEAFRDELNSAIQGLSETTSWIGQRLVEGEYDDALAAATPYLRQFGTVVGGWLMAKAAIAAKSSPVEFDDDFLADKLTTARFYGEHLLPQAGGLISTVKAGNSLLASADL